MTIELEQRLDLEREDRRHESTLARLGGRGKFTGCHQCMSPDGMRSVHQDTIARMDPYDINRNRWYRGPDGDERIFHQCWTCNWTRVIPEEFALMTLWEVLNWRDNADPMSPDYEALAAEEPRSQITDARDSAGEG